MERDKVALSEHTVRSLLDEDYDGYDETENLEYDFVEEVTESVDLEKSMECINVILRRVLDNKCFRLNYWKSPYLYLFQDVDFPIHCTEVFEELVQTSKFN